MEYSVDPSILQEQSFLHDYSEISSCPNTAAVVAPVVVVMVQRPDVVSRQRSKFPIALKQNVILKYHLFQEKSCRDIDRQLQSTYFLKAFMSQEGKIMLEDSNFEHRSKI
ncbi:Hypothetical_protein [Hexamita inflata]|uniref:Hypothetical_protein n=1 Tax=Hexamita inflata TaxID=28002 RepID=A0AA86Q1H8_9EUKA|nr:Hypothetical protein HINF_LOCUS37138 [Hexamita inflata]